MVELKWEDFIVGVGWIEIGLVKESSDVDVAFAFEMKLEDVKGVIAWIAIKLKWESKAEVVVCPLCVGLLFIDIAVIMGCLDSENVGWNTWLATFIEDEGLKWEGDAKISFLDSNATAE